jgi:leucyl aminopeptidase
MPTSMICLGFIKNRGCPYYWSYFPLQLINFSSLLKPDKGQPANTVHIIAKGGFDDWLGVQPERVRTLVSGNRFAGNPGEVIILPGDAPDLWSVAAGAGEHASIWSLAAIAAKLPEGTYRLAEDPPGQAALGWLLAHYRFDRYLAKSDPVPQRVLLTLEPASIDETIRLAEATALVRDLVNTPAADMGPADLQAQAEALANAHDATTTVTKGHDLETGYPMIYAVGMAADRACAPRLIELEWGNPANPRVAIIGKGISFDTGGLNLKPGGSMRLMKKDMGGAAHALALAKLLMEARLPVRLHLLIAAAENAVSGNAFRPGDILKSRNGMTVEIDNTDAEGRLVLADAITKAGEDKAAIIIDFATLTGAARTALGPDLPAMFANDHGLADELNKASVAVHDPVWRLPLWSGYDDMLKSDVADCVNSAEGGMAGAITAALFLRKFVPPGALWAHLDTFAWRPAAKPGRPKGGDALGLRAAYEVLKNRFPAT